MAERKDRMALLSRYSKLYAIHYGEKPSMNINVEQWAADGLIESYTLGYCYDLLQYYFDVSQKPAWKYFANYAQDIIRARDMVEQDLIERKERRKQAKEWLNE
jgi:hypothetical protein